MRKLGRQQNINEARGIEAHYYPSSLLCYRPNVCATRLCSFFASYGMLARHALQITMGKGMTAQWKPRRNILQIAITAHQSSTTKTTQLTLALLIVGDHQRVNLLLGIWFKPERCALVSFLYFMDSSNPLAFSQNRPSHVGKYVPLKSVCSRMPSTPPRAWIMSVR